MRKKKTRKKKTWIEKLGLEPTKKLTKTLCRQRVKTLRSNIEGGQYKGATLKQAKYYANWYQWKSEAA